VIHRGDLPDESSGALSIAVATTILNELFPQVLRKLDLHLHDSLAICGEKHTTIVPVLFTIPGHLFRTVTARVELRVPELDIGNPPLDISGELTSHLDASAFAAMRSAPSDTFMQVVSAPLRYCVEFEADSTQFTAQHEYRGRSRAPLDTNLPPRDLTPGGSPCFTR
jgi:hypothetical protein